VTHSERGDDASTCKEWWAQHLPNCEQKQRRNLQECDHGETQPVQAGVTMASYDHAFMRMWRTHFIRHFLTDSQSCGTDTKSFTI